MNINKRTKIVATIGPASAEKNILRQLFSAGVNVCRINFSHGTKEQHQQIIESVREINSEDGTYVAILADLQGPKIRIGEVENNEIDLKEKSEVTFTTKEMSVPGSSKSLWINYPLFAKEIVPGNRILLDDGKIILEAVSSNNKDNVVAKVISGGILSSNKGVNLPNSDLSVPSLTEKDLEDLAFAIEQQVDWIALSFVRSARDIIELKHLLSKEKCDARVVAKIEKPEAVDQIDDIVKVSDGLMVARGDLGVEAPMEQVPLIQKMLVEKALEHAKPVIIATQMMESMIENINPTRAEVNDVANAVLDGADAVMLSAETSVGKYPVKVIENMTRIIQEVEKSGDIYHKEFPPIGESDRFISDSICFSSCRLSQRVQSSGIVTMTHSGYTAFKISSFRPRAGIFIFTGNKTILTMLSLIWGVQGFYYDKFVSTDHTIADIKYLLKKEGFLKENDLIVNIASMPIQEKGQSNMLKLSYVT